MIVGIASVYLYTGLDESASKSYEAKKWLEENEIQFAHLHYADHMQFESVFTALNTWWPHSTIPITEFPFVVYDERHHDYSSIVRLIYGLEAIKASNLSELTQLGNSAQEL
jgi:hypothetical protein